ncbi:hypothetical protein ES703_57510 [subsurface metagenome]
MAKVTIIITDEEDKIDVLCEGDTTLEKPPTPAQKLAGKLLRLANRELK